VTTRTPPDPAAALDPDTVVPPAAREAVLEWYAAAGRELAFRGTRDPYAVLVSELMAQQTQAARAAEAWTAWMARWPSVQALATASVADVVRAWAGLGYNRRAVNLHRAAQAIVRDHGGLVPGDVATLERLPGIGPYTARAVAAIAFGTPVGAVDTNVRRVLGRIAAGGPEGLGDAALQALADAVVPSDAAEAWTHGLMDLGARLCRPSRPRCADCPVIPWCRHAAGERPRLPMAGRRGRGGTGPPVHRREPPFPSTRRWLRGRIIALAREARDGAWVRYGEAIGEHPPAAVREAVLAMAGEGLLEAREVPGGVPEARLPR
jgi:A/G-specific adenine glycosylase